MLIVLFLVSHFDFLFVPCGGLSWLPVSFLLQVKYTLSYRIVSSDFRIFRHFVSISNIPYIMVDSVINIKEVIGLQFVVANKPQNFLSMFMELSLSGEKVLWNLRSRE